MNRPLTIAHLSDLHISLEHSRQNVRNTRTLLEFCLRKHVDHIVITGDLTANADKKELEATRKLFRNYGLLDTRKLTVIPGNHDVFGGVHHAEEILSFPKRCKATDYERKMRIFEETFHELFENTVHGKGETFYPFVKSLHGVALFGVNSVAQYARLNNPIGSNGEVDDEQFSRLAQLLKSELFRTQQKVVLVHHHFNKTESQASGTMSSVWSAIESQTMKLRNKKRLLSLFLASKIDLVLHGHLHENREYNRKGVRFVNTGAAVLGNGRDLHATFLKVNASGIEIELHSVPHFTVATPAPPRAPQEQEFLVHEAA
jgi:3',5'-cyclic AMP phosphodiesterase CpdA